MRVTTATLLLAASSVAEEDTTYSPQSKLQAALVTIEKSLNKEQLLTEGDWTDQLKCTGDFGQQPSLVNDKATCEATTDASSKACVWCDATQAIGSGLCVSEDQKAMLGPYWQQLCKEDSSKSIPVNPTPNPPQPIIPLPPTPPPSPLVTPPPSPLVTPPPTVPPAAPNPVPEQIKCSMDKSQNQITDKVTCEAYHPDSTTTCEWCQIGFLNAGSCLTAQMKQQVSFLCSKKDIESTYLRGDGHTYDSACLAGDSGGLEDKDKCANKVDSNGKQCVYCEAAGVFGVCVTPDQKSFLGEYLSCDDETSKYDTAVNAPFAAIE